MGLTPRIWSHLAGVWQVRSVLRPPQTVYSLISTITAVPDRAPRAGGARGRRARAARAGGEYSKNFHRRAPPRPGCRRCRGSHGRTLS